MEEEQCRYYRNLCSRKDTPEGIVQPRCLGNQHFNCSAFQDITAKLDRYILTNGLRVLDEEVFVVHAGGFY